MAVVWIAVLIMGVRALGAPAIKYDQRQEGDVNIRADLENFVIVLIPTSSTNSNLGLLELLSKTLPASKTSMKHLTKYSDKKQSTNPHDPSHHFIESKAAPYHVDISRTRNHLAKLHPQTTEFDSGEVLIAHSPTVALVKSNENSVSPNESENVRSIRNIRMNRRNEQAIVVSSDLNVSRKSARAEKKGGDVNRTGENLTLLGAEMDQCGPDQKRDAQGICQLIE